MGLQQTRTVGSVCRKILVFFFLVFCTIVLHLRAGPFTDAGQNMLQNGSFHEDDAAWNVSHGAHSMVEFGNDTVRFTVSISGEKAQILQEIPSSSFGKYVRLQVSACSERIEPGAKNWNLGRVLFMQYGKGHVQLKAPHELARLDGTRSWTKFSRVFALEEETETVQVIVQLDHATGIFCCKNLQLLNVEPNFCYPFVRSAVIGVWLLFLLSVFVRRLRGVPGRKRRAGIAAVMILLVIGVSLPGRTKNLLKQDIERLPQEVGCVISGAPVAFEEGEECLLDSTKVAHFILFALLMFFFLAGDRWSCEAGWLLGDLFLLACATELMQLFIAGRMPLLSDVGIDMAGSLAGLGAYLLFHKGKGDCFTGFL